MEVEMSKPLSLHSLEVVVLADGRYGVQIIAPEALPRVVGEFDSRDEADAWILRQSLLDDESAENRGLLRPGPSLDVS
jgi:hypothetical protein